MSQLAKREINKLLEDYLVGVDFKTLMRDYNVTQNQIQKYVNQYSATRTDIEKNLVQFRAARENQIISKLKEEMLYWMKDAVKEGHGLDNKLYYGSKMKDLYQIIDQAERLNSNQATQNINVQEKKEVVQVDLAKILAELDTPEKKLAYLQNNMRNYDKSNTDPSEEAEGDDKGKAGH